MKIDSLTDDQAQLTWERQRLAVVETKLARVRDEGDREYYTKCAAGWRRSIAALEKRIDEDV